MYDISKKSNLGIGSFKTFLVCCKMIGKLKENLLPGVLKKSPYFQGTRLIFIHLTVLNPQQGRPLEIPWGRGSHKPNLLRGSMKLIPER